MKRDLDLLRNILLRIEELEPNKKRITIESFTDLCNDLNLISLHIELLLDNYFIETSSPINSGSYKDFIIHRITSDGYDYLDAVRNPSIWVKTKNKLLQVGGTATLEIIKSVAETLIRNRLESQPPL